MSTSSPEKQKEYSRRYRERNLEKVREYDRTYKKENYLKCKAAHDRYKAKNPDKIKDLAKKYRESGKAKLSQIKSRYGITGAQFEQILNNQNGICAVCGVDFKDRKRYIDHDHVTGVVRGIVHMQCNSLMGLAKDDPDILERAAKYLRDSRKDLK